MQDALLPAHRATSWQSLPGSDCRAADRALTGCREDVSQLPGAWGFPRGFGADTAPRDRGLIPRLGVGTQNLEMHVRTWQVLARAAARAQLCCHPGVMPRTGMGNASPPGAALGHSGAVLGDTGAAAGVCSHPLLLWLVVLTSLTHTLAISFSSL